MKWYRISLLVFIVLLSFLLIDVNAVEINSEWVTLFSDDFENGDDNWAVGSGMEIINEANNHVLHGDGHVWAYLQTGDRWTDYSFKTRIKLYAGGCSLNFRVSTPNGTHTRYVVNFNERGLALNKEISAVFDLLSSSAYNLVLNRWYQIEIIAIKNNFKVYIDNELQLDFTDDNPMLFGSVAFEVYDQSAVSFDDVFIQGLPPAEDDSVYRWVRTGGPLGGLGYDIRIHPANPQIMFVTDNPSGVNKSYDGGITWVQKNNGINARTGSSNDAIPIFSLSIDPGNPDRVWAGTQISRGIFKSIDGGDSWTRMNNGILERNEISFRGFAVHPQNSDIVFAASEITTNLFGQTFDRVKGKIYKTTDGGNNWRSVWEGDNLARVLIFDPSNPGILYCSTGIWDREAFNMTGMGVLKSTDGGENWLQINNGLDNLYINFLEMHPSNPQILYAAVGEHTTFTNPGVYKTIDGGNLWTKILGEGTSFINPPYWSFNDIAVSVVTMAPSNPDIVYAASGKYFYRSNDGGKTWWGFFSWGPPGIRPGIPISAVVDPNDAMTVFINNYTGGNFKSSDGGETWTSASVGYTGADLRDISVNDIEPNVVYAIGRSGPFRSNDFGQSWTGIAFGPANTGESKVITMHPQKKKELLLADARTGYINKSMDGGDSWRTVLDVGNQCYNFDESKCHGFSDIAYAPSDPNVVYAGSRGFKYDFYAVSSLGMYKSTDSGESWKSINNGLNMPMMNIHCVVVHPTNPDIVYIGTWKDGVFKTNDGGSSWIMKNNGLGGAEVRSLAIDPYHPETLYAGLGEGLGIFKSTNGGELWSEVNHGISLSCPSYLLPAGKVTLNGSLETPPQLITSQDSYSFVNWTSVWDIVINPADSQVLYAADNGGGVYRSGDGGSSWMQINTGLSFRAVSALALSSDGSLLYAATQGGGVFRMDLCSATINGNLLLHIPYLSYGNGTLSLWADFIYKFNPTYSMLIPFKLTNADLISNPSFSCAASTLSDNFKIHIPNVLLPDGVTRLWLDLEYSPALSTDGNLYWVVTNYGAAMN